MHSRQHSQPTHRPIAVFDTTLRDGEQSPGIALAPAEKVEIALLLEALRVDVIEAGFAASSPGDFQGVQAVAESVSGPTVASLARASHADLDAAAEALQGAKRSRAHIVLATSPIHMERKLKLTPDAVVAATTDSVSYARDKFDEIEFSCEDATRSDPAFVARVCRAAVKAGVTVINLPDTVGYTTPDEYGAFLKMVVSLCPELETVTLSVHCHDDLGLAVANTLAGVRAGASQVECTVNGIGERAGNASLEEVVIALRVREAFYDARTGVDVAHLHAASRLVSDLTGYLVPPNKAVVGANAFAHESGIHQDGMLKDPATYQIIDPAELGLEATLPLGKHSGRHAFSRALVAAGHDLDDDERDRAFHHFKALADGTQTPTVDDVVAQLSGVSV
jgi:2-isopropylmalate synthase